MASTDILLGRGVVTLATDDVGQCSGLVLRHQVDEVAVATWDTGMLGGAAEVARRTRVFVELTLHELTAANRAKVLDLTGDPDDVALVWTGKNANAADCATSSWTLTVPNFVLIPSPEVYLIAETFEDSSFTLTGEALRASGATSWYTLAVT